MEGKPQVELQLTVEGSTVQFRGSLEDAERFILNFLQKHVPALALARKIQLSYSLSELVEKFGDFVKVTPEGPRVVAGEGFSDRARIGLQLVAQRIAQQLGREATDTLSPRELSALTGLREKSVSSRLSEMVKEGAVEAVRAEKMNRYRITTIGIKWLEEYLAKSRRTPT
jgi:DNA-binding MarR family transcriptional regulator